MRDICSFIHPARDTHYWKLRRAGQGQNAEILTNQRNFESVLRIRIRWDSFHLRLPDPDPALQKENSQKSLKKITKT